MPPSIKCNHFPSMCVPPLLFQFWIVLCVPFIFPSLFSYFADSSILPNQTTGVFPIGIVVSPPPLIYPQTVSITLEGWCAKGSLVFTTGNPLYIHVTFSRSFSVGRVVNFPKFQFILSAGPLGHPPITPLCSSNWAQDPGCPSLLLDQYTHSLAVTLFCCLFCFPRVDIYQCLI